MQAYYVTNGQVSDSPATDCLLVYLHLHSYSDNYAGNARNQPAFRDEAALFCALGWYVRGNETLRQFAKARIDVRLGNHHLMRVIFIIGKKYMNARMALAVTPQRAIPPHTQPIEPQAYRTVQ
jgi:hypothetical protein